MPPVDRNADYEKETAAFRIFRQGPRRPFTGSSLPDHGLAPAVPSALKEETNAPFFMTTHDRSAILHPSLMAPAQALISDGAKWIDTSPGSPQVRCRFLFGQTSSFQSAIVYDRANRIRRRQGSLSSLQMHHRREAIFIVSDPP